MQINKFLSFIIRNLFADFESAYIHTSIIDTCRYVVFLYSFSVPLLTAEIIIIVIMIIIEHECLNKFVQCSRTHNGMACRQCNSISYYYSMKNTRDEQPTTIDKSVTQPPYAYTDILYDIYEDNNRTSFSRQLAIVCLGF